MTTWRDDAPDAVFEVLDPGFLTTVQDAGRPGLGSLGISPGGAADPWSLAVANACAGNGPGDAGLELTLGGPVLRVLQPVTIAVGGADLGGRVEDIGHLLSPGVATPLRAGWTVSFPGPSTGGARAYLAVAGGFAVPTVLGSRSTALGAGFGGLDGRALRAGDLLSVGAPAADRVRPAARWPGPLFAPRGGAVRVLRGPHEDLVDPDLLQVMAESDWTVTGSSDRMGLRLDGPPLPGSPTGELASHGVTWGAVQVPPDRRPIVLLADHQPTGGYPVIAVVITADLPALGQLGPGDAVRFELTDLPVARRALAAQRSAFAEAVGQVRDAARWDELWYSARG